MKPLLMLFLVLLAPALQAQPFVDLVAIDHMRSPGAMERTQFSATLPIRLDSAAHLLVTEPYFVDRRTTAPD